MYENNTSKSAFNATTENILNSDLENRLEPNLYSIVSEEVYGDMTISHAEFRFYTIISGYCGTSGVCYISQKALEERLPWVGQRNFEKITKSLEQKGFLFRNQLHSRYKGSSRQLVVKCHWQKYFNTKWKERDLDECAKVEAFFTGSDKDYLRNRYQQDIQHRVDLKAKKNNKNIEKSQPTEGVTPRSQRRTPRAVVEANVTCGSRNSTNVLYDRRNNVDDLDVVVSSKLERSNLSEEDLKIALKYWQMNREKLAEKENPVGWILMGLKRGWVKENVVVVAKKEEEEKESHSEVEGNMELAAQVFEELKGDYQQADVNVNENCIRFDFYDKVHNSQTVMLGWKEEGFEKKIMKLKERYYDCIRSSRKACSLETSRS